MRRRAVSWHTFPRPTVVVSGPVLRGRQLGRTLGFPTANVRAPADFSSRRGVYKGIAELSSGERFWAAVNVGVRPTIERSGELLVEAHLIDFEGDLYEQQLRIELHGWLRAEARFDGIEALGAQLREDVETVRRWAMRRRGRAASAGVGSETIQTFRPSSRTSGFTSAEDASCT